VRSTKKENRFRALQKLLQKFQPGLSCKQVVVISELSNMLKTPAKTTAELKIMMTDLEEKMKQTEEITGEQVSQLHAKSVLIGIPDLSTR